MTSPIKRNKFNEVSWTGTWAFSDGSLAGPTQLRTYFLKTADGMTADRHEFPYVQAEVGGWNVMLDGDVLQTFKLKNDAQRAAEELLD